MRSRSFRRGPRRRHGFTLIEVLTVLLILVVLASIVVGAYRRVSQNAMVDTARSQLGMFKTPLEMYFLAFNMYPIQPPQNLTNPAKWAGPYLDTNMLPTDPWGNPYQYASPGRYNVDTYDVWSLGPDQADGTEDDIGNW